MLGRGIRRDGDCLGFLEPGSRAFFQIGDKQGAHQLPAYEINGQACAFGYGGGV